MSIGKVEVESGDFDPEKSQYRALTDLEVADMARKIYRNEIFTSWMIHQSDEGLITGIFMPLMFIDEVTRREMIRDKIAHFYADMGEAGPRTINGYPIFMSMGMLNGPDAKRIHDKYLEIKTLLGDI
jgi:hypothetical protein